MTYAVIQPPFTLEFREMSKRELRSYYEWFMDIAPQRVAALESAVRQSASFASWRADRSPDSLNALGEWFIGQVETRRSTEDELRETKSRLVFSIEIPDRDLTNRSFSLAMDIGMYFAQVLLMNVPNLRWEQPLKSKNDADYGQPVVAGHGRLPVNPVRISVVLAYGISRKKHEAGRLRAVYDYWAKAFD